MLLEPAAVIFITLIEAAACVAILVLFWRHVEAKDRGERE